MKKIITLSATLLAGLSLTACSSSQTDSSSSSSADNASSTEVSSKSSSTSSSKVPAEYSAALDKAKSYATTMDMSEQGVRDQLASSSGEDFPDKAVNYAMNHLTGIDWNKNALAKAKTYQKEMDMSDNAIKEQLTSSAGEKFTASQAEYAVRHLSD